MDLRSDSTGAVSPLPPAYQPDEDYLARTGGFPSGIEPTHSEAPPPRGLSSRPKNYIAVTDRDVGVLTSLAVVHHLCKLWWVICVSIGMLTTPHAKYSSGYTDDSFSGAKLPSNHRPILPEMHHHSNLSTSMPYPIFQGHVGGGGTHTAFKMAVAAIVITLCVSLVTIGVLQRIKTKDKNNMGIKSSRSLKVADTKMFQLGEWWETYITSGLWVEASSEVFSLVITVWLVHRCGFSYKKA